MIRFALLGLLSLLLWAPQSSAQSHPGTLDLRVGLQPLTFQAGMTSSLVGGAVRVEADPIRALTVQLQGRLPYVAALGQDADPAVRPSGRASLLWHVVDEVRTESEDETVRPQDPSMVGPAALEAGHDISTVYQRLGSPRMHFPGDDGARNRFLGVRHVQTLRLHYDFVQAAERLATVEEARRYAVSQRHMLSLGYSFGSHWYAPPELEREDYVVGYRRYYFDVTFSPSIFGTVRTLPGTTGSANEGHFSLGGRIGMEGALDGVLDAMPGLGLSYTLELGALPAVRGIEGYMLIGLGLELDFALRGVPDPGGQ